MAISEAKWFWRGLGLLLFVAAFVAIFFLRQNIVANEGVLAAPLDDAWIHLQYARNLQAGAGFSFNPGVPTPGSTAPLWTIMLAALHGVGEQPLTPAIGLSLLFFLLTVAMTAILARELGLPDQYALLVGAGVVVTGRFLWAGLSGMEATAFAFFVLLALWLQASQRPVWLIALTLGLASQLRPEGHLFFMLFGLGLLWSLSKKETNWQTVLLAGLIYGLINLPYTLFALQTTGRPLANTFYVKSSSATFYSLKTLIASLRQHGLDNPIGSTALIFGLFPLWQKGKLSAAYLLMLLLVMPMVVASVAHHGRYTMPIIPLQIMFGSAGIYWLTNRLTRQYSRSRKNLLAAGLAGLFIAGGVWQLPFWQGQLITNSSEIQQIDVAIGEWLKLNTAEDAVIAIDDIGAISYISGREIFDMQGLVSPEIWPVFGNEDQVALTVRAMHKADVTHAALFYPWHPALIDSNVTTEISRFHSRTHTMILDDEAIVALFNDPYAAGLVDENIAEWTLGVRATVARVVVDDTITLLTLQWEVLADQRQKLKVFVHILDEADNIVAQADHVPGQGMAPTQLWQAGDIISYEVVLPAISPGQRVVLGFYDEVTFVRPRLAQAVAPIYYDGTGIEVPVWHPD